MRLDSLCQMILRDPVHGLISFSDPIDQVVVRLLDTPQVQRLRRIRCLGPASLAFPGAEHSRFAHAIGAAYVMKRYLQRVAQLGNDIPARDRVDAYTAQVALAAALLHDLGHGPFSHAFETVLPVPFNHEDRTSALILDPDNAVYRVLAEIDPSMPVAVERLVRGSCEVPHLARAVSGTFDVDRCDYLLRDSHMTGVRYGVLDLDWLLQALRLHVAPGDDAASLAIDGEKGLTAVEGFFLGRLYMYRQVYLHKAVRAAEALLRALLRRLTERPPHRATPAALQRVLSGHPVDTATMMALDDCTLECAFMAYGTDRDPLLAELARAWRDRRLFKTLRLRDDVPHEEAQARLEQLLARNGAGPAYLGTIDRVEISTYTEDQALKVIGPNGRLESLLDASPVLRGLSNERFVNYRAIFPAHLRDAVRAHFDDLR